MRKFILIAAMVLASATAQAEVGRSLSLASSEEPVAAEQLKAIEAPKAEQKSAGSACICRAACCDRDQVRAGERRAIKTRRRENGVGLKGRKAETQALLD